MAQAVPVAGMMFVASSTFIDTSLSSALNIFHAS